MDISDLKFRHSLTLKNIQGVKDSLVESIIPILNELYEQGWQPIIACGLRSVTDEIKAVQAGNSQTMHSKHLTGDAVDIVDARYGWDQQAAKLTYIFWERLGDEVLKYPNLGWGGIWYHPDRLAIYKEACDTNNEKLITWFADVAHVENKYAGSNK